MFRSTSFQLTRSVGSVTRRQTAIRKKYAISTHTLRGERDTGTTAKEASTTIFQLTRSVGSVTINNDTECELTEHFNSHAPWGA